MSQIRHAYRSLVRRPAFTAAAVLTLAAGMAVTTTMFAVVHTVVLKPLPFPDADRLVTVYEASPARRESASLVAPARIDDWMRLTRTIERISGSYAENLTETSGDAPERLAGRRTLPGFLAVFGATPVAGRLFTADEERHGGPRAAVVSESYWTRRFGRSDAAIGSRLAIAGEGYPIVGVLPASFTSAATDVWIPAQLAPWLAGQREARFIGGIARIRPGFTIEDARTDLAGAQQILGREFPASDKGWSVLVQDLKAARIGDARQRIAIVFAAVSTLLLIAVANVAGLMLVQLRRRTRELAVRSAIGASRLRVVYGIVQEALLIVAAGAVLGGMTATWLIATIGRMFPDLPRVAELGFDLRTGLFVALLGLGAATLFGVVPALLATRKGVSLAQASGGRGETAGGHRFQSALVVVQIASSLALAGSAGLLIRSYQQLSQAESGFDAGNTLTFHVGAAWDEDRGRVGVMQQQLLAELAGLPGVTAAGFTNFLPSTGATLRYQVRLDGAAGDQGDAISVGFRTVTDGYLEALQVPLLSGARCGALRPDPAGPGTVLVNRRFADTHASGQNLIGRRMRIEGQPGDGWRIVGIVGDLVEDGPGASAVPYIYSCAGGGGWPDPEYVIRVAGGDPLSLLPAVRDAVRRVAPARPVFGAKPLADVMAAALDAPRVNSGLLTGFAGCAIALSGLGLYGLLMLYVMERRSELGIRMALGATPGDVVRLVLGSAARLLALGVPLGGGLTLVAGRALRGVLFGVTPVDVGALGGAAGVLILVALAAVSLPALRASRISALEAMRSP